jgi:hypothetical protein
MPIDKETLLNAISQAPELMQNFKNAFLKHGSMPIDDVNSYYALRNSQPVFSFPITEALERQYDPGLLEEMYLDIMNSNPKNSKNKIVRQVMLNLDDTGVPGNHL